MRPSRRSFLEISGLSFAAPFVGALRAQARVLEPFGPLAAARDATTGLPLLEIPPGFRYLTFGWTGDPMSNGERTPAAHDGMAAFPGPAPSRVRLVRNHEVRPAGVAFGTKGVYDPAGAGGTTTLEFDTKTESLVSCAPSLCGTSTNCAGGPTPWGSWISCEEIVDAPAEGVASALGFTRKHGYVFEVPANGVSSGEPLKGMGCFVHEAVAVDKKSGAVFLTEDSARAGLYRYTPKKKGDLKAGGTLHMLGVHGTPQADLRDTPMGGPEWKVRWFEIGDPDRGHSSPTELDREGVFRQGYDQGAAVFRRLEGAWAGRGRIYFTSTSGGAAKLGQVWELDPAKNVLRLAYESKSRDLLQGPDNLCVSPKGGLVICEDSVKPNSVRGLRPDGTIVTLARNVAVLDGRRNGFEGDYSPSEFAGATFSPDGKWLFFNIQRPGITIAMTGPWADAGL